MADTTHPDPAEQGAPAGAQAESPQPGRHDTPNPEVAHEPSDVDVKYVLWFAVGLVVAAVLIHLGLAWMFFAFRSEEDRAKESGYPLAGEERREQEEKYGRPMPAAPRLEGIEGRQEERAGEPAERRTDIAREEDLFRYGWADEKKGLVSIPIERA